MLFCLIVVQLSHSVNRESFNYYFSRVSVKDGLSESNVKAIIQDSYGFMWFGTKNGLNRYDGSSIQTMNCNDYVSGTGNHNIGALFEDTNRKLWVGTDRGVYIYDPVSDIFTFVNKVSKDGKTMDNWVADIVSDHSGNIWILIPDQGVFRYKEDKLYFYGITNKDKFKTESPGCICIRENGEVWVGTTGAGLFLYDPKKDSFTNYHTDEAGKTLLGKNIYSICEYGSWLAIAIHDGELKKYHPASNTLKDIAVPDSKNNLFRDVTCINNELWLGTQAGLYVINESENKVTHVKEDLMHPYSLADNAIFVIYKDREGGIWLGTLFGGANYLPNHQVAFEKYVPESSEHSLGTKRIRELVEGSDGNIWIGTEDNGVNVLNPKDGKVERIRSGSARNNDRLITLSMFAYKDRVWCGLFKQGLDIFQLPQRTVKHYSSKELNLGEESVYCLYVDRKGQTWLGNGWGLYKAPPGTLNFARISDVGYDWIFKILEDRKGNLWIASMGNGVWKYNPQKNTYRNYSSEPGNKKSLSSNSVSSIIEDSKGRIWFSTDRGGICRYNEKEDNFTTFSINEGLPDDVAYSILEDNNKNFWFGTNRGLVKFNPETKSIRVFTVQDGLLGNQFNYNSALKASNGKFYFGGVDGLIAFNPNIADKKNFVPPVYISKFSIYNKEVTVHSEKSPLTKSIIHTSQIVLDYNQSNITFGVSLPSFSDSKAYQCYYRMDPVDEEWIKLNNTHDISYAQLPPGNYTLQVRATNGNANVELSSASLHITILPPWWLSVGAYIIYSIFIMSILSSWFYWYRRRKERQMKDNQKLFEIEKEKELYEAKVEFFTEIAHEVRTPLTLINGPLETILDMGISDPKITKNLQVIAQNTNRLLELTGQLLDFRKVGANKFLMHFTLEDITSLLNETVLCFEPTILQQNKELMLDIPDEQIQAAVDKEAFIKIVSNLLNNALKYTNRIIRIELKRGVSSFHIKVTSDGNKIPRELSQSIFEPFYQMHKQGETMSGAGIGLPLARSLTNLHQGRLYLDVDAENNTFVLTLPLNQEKVMQKEDFTVSHELAQLEEDVPSTFETKNYTILLVEDNATMLSFISEKLQELFAVETAQSGQDALDILSRDHVDLIISDVMMPGMNGIEFCKMIKANIELCHIPVIFLTARNDLESKIQGLRAGAEAYVEKPFSFNYLKTQVLSLLDNRRKEREAFSKRPFFPVHNMHMSKADEEFMDQIIGIIHENITDVNFNVERLADILCMSRSSLLRKIKVLSDLSPVDLIRLVRLKKAAELIQEGKCRINEICDMVGIGSPSYFSKLFQKQFGVTPKEFEKQNQFTKEK